MDKGKEFYDSLDLTDREMEQYLPYALQDLWEIGSIPEFVIRLIKENVKPEEIKSLVDLSCGKGSVLIKLGKHFNFNGTGIDLFPEFIDEAKKYYETNPGKADLQFRVNDLRDEILKISNQNVIIFYAYDTGILGNVYETIIELKKCLSAKGYLILELVYTSADQNKIEGIPNEDELIKQINQSGVAVIDKIIWDVSTVKEINNFNNKFIGQRIEELKIKFPEKKNLFDSYMKNQFAECELLETGMICSTWLLKNKN